MKTVIRILMVLSLSLVAAAAHSQQGAAKPEWPQWRGPERTGRSAETGLLKEWPEGGPKKLWSVTGLGEGYSSITVKDGRIYTMGTADGKEVVIALDYETGKKLWTGVSSDRVWTERRGNGPRCSPTTDGDFLYTEDTSGNVICSGRESGRKVWEVSLTRDLGGSVPKWAYSESPLIVGNACIVTPGGSKGAIAAVNKRTGKVIWQSSEAKDPAGYSSAILATLNGRRQIINAVQKGMVGVDAETGKLLWRFPGKVADVWVAATPIAHDDMVFISSAYNSGGGAARITARGAEQLWFNPSFQNHHGGVIRVGEYLYGYYEVDRALHCVEMKTGKVAWKSRSVGKCSLVYADGHLYCLSEKQVVGLVEATPEAYREKGRFTIPKSGMNSWPHPVVVGGRLFIRDQDTLTCWDVKAK